MALAGTARQRLLEGEVLLAAEQKEIAHRGIVIGPMQHGVGGDANAAGQGDLVGRIPPGCRHGAHELGFASDEPDIDGIAGMAVARLRQARRLDKERVTAKVEYPQLGHDQIGGNRPDQGDREQRLGVEQMEMQHGA